jgi:hypothetical protein
VGSFVPKAHAQPHSALTVINAVMGLSSAAFDLPRHRHIHVLPADDRFKEIVKELQARHPDSPIECRRGGRLN